MTASAAMRAARRPFGLCSRTGGSCRLDMAMSVFQNITKGSLIKGSAYLIVLAGALGVYLRQWGMFGFFLPHVPLWCFGVIAAAGGVLFFLGPMSYGSASVSSPEQLFNKPEGTLFLYLRPFELDARNLLQPIVGASAGPLTYLNMLRGWWLPVSFLPFLINISKEQGFHDALRPLGEFIAIGRPRERLRPIGASRVYVGDDWKQEIASYAARAKLVILRPGETEGIQWEVEHALSNVSPERLLFYLQFRWGRKRREMTYEAFRAHLYKVRRINLPQQMGRARYLLFDTSWNGYFVREANHPAELIRQIFSRSGDVTRDRFRPVFKAFNIELPAQPNTLLNNFVTVLLWLSALIAVLLVSVAAVLSLILLITFLARMS